MARISVKVDIKRRDAAVLDPAARRRRRVRRSAAAGTLALAMFGLAGSMAAAVPAPNNVAAGLSAVPPFKIINNASIAANKSLAALVLGGNTKVPTDAALVQLTISVTPKTTTPGSLAVSPAPLGSNGTVLSWSTTGVQTTTVVVGVGASNKDTFTNVSTGSIGLTVTVTGFSADNVSSVFGQNTGTAQVGTNGAAPCTVGSVWLQAGTLTGTNTLLAAGQLLPIQGNAPLFSIVGTTYGGDGHSNFGLPSLQSVAPNGLSYVICVFGVFP